SSMITLDHLAAARSAQNHITEYRK
ncbi:MAG: cold-shock protein, partial [Enterobacter sp.]|nr:cold-shock protein [Enterobacter sp.]